MILRGCQLLQSNGRHWVGLPSKAAVDKAGAPVLGDNGKPIYRPIVEFANKETRDKFGNAATAAALKAKEAAE